MYRISRVSRFNFFFPKITAEILTRILFGISFWLIPSGTFLGIRSKICTAFYTRNYSRNLVKKIFYLFWVFFHNPFVNSFPISNLKTFISSSRSCFMLFFIFRYFFLNCYRNYTSFMINCFFDIKSFKSILKTLSIFNSGGYFFESLL